MLANKEVLLIVSMMIVTFSIRYILWGFAEKIQLSPFLERALSYVPPAVLTALIIPAIIMPHGSIEISFYNSYLMGGIGATCGGLLLKEKALLGAIVSGLTVFIIWQLLIH